MARLLVITPEGQRTVELGATNSLGRHPGNTVQLLDRIVSKEHCIIEQRTDGFWLRDLGSLNGTYINNERVQGEQALKHADEIVMGSSRAWFDDGRGLSAESLQVGSKDKEAVAAPIPGHVPGSMNLVHLEAHGGVSAASAASASGGEGGSGVADALVAEAINAPIPLIVPAKSPVAPTPAAAPAMNLSGALGAGPVRSRSVGTMAIPVFGAEGSKFANLGRVDFLDEKRAIGTQIAAKDRGFRPFEQLVQDPVALQADYERLRLSHELSREIALEHDTTQLLGKILLSIFKFVQADRGVIFLRSDDGTLEPGASLRRDGSSAPIVVSSTILNHVQTEKAAVLTHDAAMDFAASKGKSMILNRISSAIVVPLLHNDNFLGVLWLDSASLAQFQPKDLEIVTGVAAQAAMFIENNALAKKIEQELVTRERFSRLLSPNLAERVISGELEVKKGGQLVQECTVFNSDIRGFTQMSSSEKPEIIVEMLNEYFELMVETLFKYEGTLDKFMGDGLMALWGAPIAHPDDPVRAVDCALHQMEILGDYNRERQKRNVPQLGIGIGIHTGPLVAGYIGSSRALSYTVIGDTVNVSARLCSHAKVGQIIVTRMTLDRLANRFEYEELEPAKLKGKDKPVAIFNVLRRNPTVQVP